MNIALWIVQGLLALTFLAAGGLKLFSSKEKLAENPKLGWTKDTSAASIKLLGLAEVLGAVGVVVPWATGIVPVLTPIAAACLGFLMVGATVMHVRRKEPAAVTIVFTLLCVLVAVFRFRAA